jgi:hypothetical protein
MTSTLLKRLILGVFFVSALGASTATALLEPPAATQGEVVVILASPQEPMIGPRLPETNHEQIGTGSADLSDLPAWRWAKPLGPPSLGLRGLIDSAGSVIFTALSTIIFAIASLIWWALREVMRIGLTANLVGVAAQQINETFAAVGSNFGLDTGAGKAMLILLALPLFLVLVRFALRRQTESIVRTLIWFALPIALLQAMLSTAGGVSGTPGTAPQTPNAPAVVATADDVTTGSPAWVALTGVEFVDTVSGLVNNIELPDSDAVIWTNDPDPACGDYVAALYNRYLENAGDPDLAGVSKLWEAGFASNYFTAQFGTDFGGRIGCYYLEKGNRVTPDEMYAVALAAGYGEIPGMGKGPFTIRDGAKYTTADMYAFAACQWNGSSWTVTPGFDKLEGSAGHSLAEQGAGVGVGDVNDRDVTPNACTTWWTSTGEDGSNRLHDGGVILEWSSARQLDGLRLKSDDTAAQAAGKQAARDSIEAFWGFNGFDRILRAVVAFFVALLYLWGLGGLAIGALLAQLGLVLLLALAPLTLVLLAVPTKNGGRNPLGVRLGKMTIGFLASKLVLAVVIALVVRSILLIDAVIRAWMPGLDWFGALLAPAAALLLMRKILKSAGMGDLMKLSGSVGMTAAVAAGADRGVAGSLKTGALRDQVAQTKYGKAGLDRLDRASDAVTGGYKAALKGTIASPYTLPRAVVSKTADAIHARRQPPLETPLTATGKGHTPLLNGFAGRFPNASAGSSDPRSLQGLSREAQLDKVDQSVRTLAGLAAIDDLVGPGKVKTVAGKEAQKLRPQAFDSRKGLEALEDKTASAEQLRARQEAVRDSLLEAASYRTGLVPDHIKNGMQKDHEVSQKISAYGTDGWVVSNELYGAVPAAGYLSEEAVKKMGADQKRNYLSNHPSLVYDVQIRERFKGESDTDYVRRITHLEIEMGHRTLQGAPVDLVETLNLSDAAIDQVLLGNIQVNSAHRPSATLNQKVRSELATVARARAKDVKNALAHSEQTLAVETSDLVALYSDQNVAFEVSTEQALAALAAAAATQAAIDDCSSLDRQDAAVAARLDQLTAEFEQRQGELRAAHEAVRNVAATLGETAAALTTTRVVDAMVGLEARSATSVSYEAHSAILAQAAAEEQITTYLDTLLGVEALAAAATPEGLERYREQLTQATGSIIGDYTRAISTLSERRDEGLTKQRKQRRKTGKDYVIDGPGVFR